MRLFEETFKITEQTRILDVGGSPFIWQFASVTPRLTFLNLPGALAPPTESRSQVAADGRFLPFADRSFDIVFSNSVIEHVGDHDNQIRFAEEVRRVGNAYWVQTPNRTFPVEMHLMLPLVHFLPSHLQRSIVYRFTGWEKFTRPTAEERESYLEHCLQELKLLDRRSLKDLFPDAKIAGERVFGLTKSLVAMKCRPGQAVQ